jgi:mannose/fructose-specific phosphotransferase system component IIA
MASGSCLIAALAQLRTRPDVKVVTGVNLAMLVDFVFHLSQTADAAAARAASTGERAIKVP